MNRYILFNVFFLLGVGGFTSDAHARRGIPIPVFWGSGEKMTDLGVLPADVSRSVAEELGSSVEVAFLHERVHLFWLDLWTWNGRHVIRAGDSYWQPDSKDWKDMIGEEPSSKYGTPILYRVPLMPALIGVLVVGYVVRKQFFKTEQEKLEAMMRDKRYERAIETIFGNEESETAATSMDEQKFLNAKNQLIAEGIDSGNAETNLRKITDAIIANTNAQIDAYLEVASQLDEAGELSDSAEVYSQVVSSLPETDERKELARKSLESVNQKLAANETEPNDGAA